MLGELIGVEYIYQQTGEVAKVYKSAIQEHETGDVCVAEDVSYVEPVDFADLTFDTFYEEEPPRVLSSAPSTVPSEKPSFGPSQTPHSLQRIYNGCTETCLVRCLPLRCYLLFLM